MALKREELKEVRQRKYLAKDFDGLRAQLLEYARLYYPDKIRDFSENSLGGVFLDLAAFSGDVMSFYLDHQYGELNYDTAVETPNIERALKNAGVPVVGASPAVLPLTLFVEIPVDRSPGASGPLVSSIPIIQAGSIFTSDNSVDFILLEDVDFNKKKSDGTYVAQIKVGQKTLNGNPATYIMSHTGLCISGQEAVENVSIGSEFVPFRKITLRNANVSEITNVSDSYGNIYYKVGALAHDVIYKNVLNTTSDSNLVKDAIKVIPAPYRYIAETDLATRKTVLTFGGGSANTLEDDVIPDPSEFAISFPYTTTFSRIPVNPQQLLQTKTLGVAAVDTTLQINYRYGGGLNHNVPASTVRTVKTLRMFFPGNPQAVIAANVRSSVECINRVQGSGGEDAPTMEDLRELIPAIKNSQERIVTREDLLARVYTLPSNFGRVFRASSRSNPNNPLTTQLFIVSRDPDSRLIISPDTLKRNLRIYLNPYRMISDAIDVLDARIINLTLSFEVMIDPALNRNVVMQQILTRLQSFFNIRNFHIDQPIVISDVVNNIYAIQGVISVGNTRFESINGTVGNRTYSDELFDISAYTRHGIIFPPDGGIFEMRFPEYDIIAKAMV